ncbi:MAG: sigma 54-interacting transcriptional regulator [Syntrophobacterales bacterium]|nr:sigma 54-interacting transcriptional regulator [Syntrophobacterales bacterium]
MSYAPIRKAPLPEPGISPGGGQARVLVIEPDDLFREWLADLLKEMGHRVETAASLAQGGAKAAQGLWDLVLVDMRLPDGSGLELLPQVQRLPQAPRICLIAPGDTAYEEVPKAGVAGVLRRSASLKETRALVTRALAVPGAGRSPVAFLPLRLEEVVGRSAAMRPCYEVLARAAGEEGPVLLVGEAGTGRGLFARLLHAHSRLGRGPLVTVSAAALGENSLAPASPWPALSRQAQGGTLFIREVEALSPEWQRSLASLLSRRRAVPEAGFRVVAASSRDLSALVREGAFLKDLWEELSGLTICLPPLRERAEDIPELAFFHLMRLCPPGNWKGLAPDVLEALVAYPWPGNVAELVAVLQQALQAAGAEPVLRAWHLPPELRPARTPVPEEAPAGVQDPGPAGVSFREFRRRVLAQAEKAYMEDLMTRARHNVKEACRLSALSLPRLYALLKKYHLRA